MTTSTALVLARRIGIVLLFVVILLRPGVGRTEVPTQLSDLDVVVVIDRTRSMAALDYDGNQPRITGAKADLTALAAALPGVRFAMLAFGTDARVVLPLTSDSAAFDAAVETLYLEKPKDGIGSRADRPVPELKDLLERAAQKAPQRRRIVVYVGDGEDTTSEGRDETYTDVADLVAGGVVLGYGTADGAPMPEDDELDGDLGLVQDPETGDTAQSHADLGNLEQVADELGVPLEHRTRPGGVDELAAAFAASYSDGAGDRTRPAQHDLTWLAGVLLLALLLLELHAGWRAVWASRTVLAPPRPARKEAAR
ncbi:VWA domain-containing protein [Nocardioides daeguensis]|uniref:VWFA domain-containing protein n=1 Tax=Nocardioides daeguensis TaxID=908359 RepID=A0ABP6W5W8_9ACTN|nr:vWA domain-containing protein [Nocardioides daeguensis]MBV6727777.1 VWA domain-containing protein [Nocardioides daeguensis]MCR1775249.1 VWA domain-containing protein [Nocardioides daeguensis]